MLSCLWQRDFFWLGSEISRHNASQNQRSENNEKLCLEARTWSFEELNPWIKPNLTCHCALFLRTFETKLLEQQIENNPIFCHKYLDFVTFKSHCSWAFQKAGSRLYGEYSWKGLLQKCVTGSIKWPQTIQNEIGRHFHFNCRKKPCQNEATVQKFCEIFSSPGNSFNKVLHFKIRYFLTPLNVSYLSTLENKLVFPCVRYRSEFILPSRLLGFFPIFSQASSEASKNHLLWFEKSTYTWDTRTQERKQLKLLCNQQLTRVCSLLHFIFENIYFCLLCRLFPPIVCGSGV